MAQPKVFQLFHPIGGRSTALSRDPSSGGAAVAATTSERRTATRNSSVAARTTARGVWSTIETLGHLLLARGSAPSLPARTATATVTMSMAATRSVSVGSG